MNLNQLKRMVAGLALAGAALAGGTANAYEVTIDVSGIESRDDLGAAGNETRFVDLFAHARIIGLAWNVSLETVTPSWLSEISVDLNDGGTAGVTLSPGFGDNVDGAASYSGSADLDALGIAFSVGTSGRLFMEFFETFDDFAGAADGYWRSGSLTVTYASEPASLGLAAIALLGVAGANRRRKQPV